MYPTKMEVNGKTYQINTDYQVALQCFKAINDDTINDTERALAVVTLLLGKDVPIEDITIALEKCAIYLRCGKKENANKDEIDMDYFQDETAIKTSIRQCYHINLNKEQNVHWWEYNELIEGLTEETLLSKIREIRNYNVNEEMDSKTKKKIMEAKEFYALKKEKKLTKEQEASMNNLNKLLGL